MIYQSIHCHTENVEYVYESYEVLENSRDTLTSLDLLNFYCL